MGREKRRGKRSEAAAHAKAELQRLIEQSKTRMWNEYLWNLMGGHLWGAPKLANPRVGDTMEGLTDGERKQETPWPRRRQSSVDSPVRMKDGDQY